MRDWSVIPLHKPVIVNEGIWAMHDVACAVCHTEKAVYDCNEGVFEPCRQCQEDGWRLVGPAHGWRRVFDFIATGGYSELRRRPHV
jgi:hypothetical protein